MLVAPPRQQHRRWGTASTPGSSTVGSWWQRLCIIQNQPEKSV